MATYRGKEGYGYLEREGMKVKNSLNRYSYTQLDFGIM